MACFVPRDRPARSGAASREVVADARRRSRRRQRRRLDSYTRTTGRALPKGQDVADPHTRRSAPP